MADKMKLQMAADHHVDYIPMVESYGPEDAPLRYHHPKAVRAGEVFEVPAAVGHTLLSKYSFLKEAGDETKKVSNSGKTKDVSASAEVK